MLPKGGGAIRGIGEKFGANPVSGTGAFTVPIATSPGRADFGPRLTLSYDSGAGNGPFGLGWHLDLPAVSRKTDKGMPRYFDGDGSDVFVLSGAEDLVPVLDDTTLTRKSTRRVVDGIDYEVIAYRPRTEGLYARIERWTADTGVAHWRSISRDNVTTVYGTTLGSRIGDPADARRVFSWLISETWDDRGNWAVYGYTAEDSAGVDTSQIHERNRSAASRTAQRYLKRIRYGNRVSREVDLDVDLAEWMFELVLDYGEHDLLVPRPGETAARNVRTDPFSTYRAGFEVRTHRLCRRALMFHHFPDELEIGADCLVRSTEFRYEPGPVVTTLAAVTQVGHRRDGAGYRRAPLPPVEFDYSSAELDREIRTLDPSSAWHLPQGIDDGSYRLVDLDGSGLAGVLSTEAGAWRHAPNLGGGQLGAAVLVASAPADCDLRPGRGRLLDLAGDGTLDVVDLDRAPAGFYERTPGGWDPLTPLRSTPALDWHGPHLHFVDLTGDGLADVLVVEDDALVWYASLGEEGYTLGGRVARSIDEEAGPRLVLADAEQSIALADLSGDGLADLVRIRSGEICYWPNLGYGRFGAKVTMDAAPDLGPPGSFDPRRIRLIDVDGSGPTDLVYLTERGATLYVNESGNRWSSPFEVDFPIQHELATVDAADLLGTGTGYLVWSSPLPGDADRPLRYLDLMGGRKPHLLVGMRNNLGAETRIEYAPSTGFLLADAAEGRPWATRLPFPVHVVARVETLDHISGHRFATRYRYHHGYFDPDEREFRGFGMVETIDTDELGAASGQAGSQDAASFLPPSLTKTWYHTGAYLEGATLSARFSRDYYREGDPSARIEGPDAAGLRAMLLADTVLPSERRTADGGRVPWRLSVDEEREACRALRGAVLREEVYALDDTEFADRPYRVAERSHAVELLQPRAGGNRHAVVVTHARESIEFQYERALFGSPGAVFADPRVTHELVLDVDFWGNVTTAASVAYGRRRPDPDPRLTAAFREAQAGHLITVAETAFTNAVLSDDAHRAPLPSAARIWELIQVKPTAPVTDAAGHSLTPLFTLDELRARLAEAAAAPEVLYENVTHAGLGAGPHRRLVEHVQTRYRRDDLTDLLPRGELHARALPGESYRLAFTPGLLAEVYRRDGVALLPADPATLLGAEGGYVRLTGSAAWWAPGGRSYCHPDEPADEAAFAPVEREYARTRFYLPHRYVDPFGTATRVAYDEPHLLHVVETRDGMDNVTRADHDYRVLVPWRLTDANGNVTEAAFDAQGLVVATAVVGKAGGLFGDNLDAFRTTPGLADPPLAEAQAFVADPATHAAALLGAATTRTVYDLDRFSRCGQPVSAAALTRETHVADVAPVRIKMAFTYSDGFGREVQTKIMAEPGDAPARDPDTVLPTGDVRPGGLRASPPVPVARRWVGTGRTVYDNKGNPVRRFEPFFSSTHLCEDEREVTDTGVSTVLCRDPVGRVVATLRPDDTYEKVVFDPWRQADWDADDTVAGDPAADPDVAALVRGPVATRPPGWQTWYERRISGTFGPTQEDRDAAAEAAAEAAHHAGTPAVTFTDALGRPFLTVADNGPGGFLPTRTELDVEGNHRAVVDARGIVVAATDFDLLGRPLHTSSPDAGAAWTLPDVAGRPLRAWDARGVTRRTTYDALRRPTAVFVALGAGAERCTERVVYGDAVGAATNHRGRVHRVYDGAGVAVSDAYDGKGNLLRSTRRLLADHRADVDWPEPGPALDALLEPEAFTGATTYDALDRVAQAVAPHSDAPGTTVSVTRPAYSEANLLARLDAWTELPAEPAWLLLDPATATHAVVTAVEHNARGQRVRVAFGNGVVTTYDYDAATFRLRRLVTRRAGDVLQDLTYDHDPAGNVTRIRDGANDRVIHDNAVVRSGGEYRYDATYRLVAARGREHRGGDAQVGPDAEPWTVPTLPNDGLALRSYVELYRYDAAGNILGVEHRTGEHVDAPGSVVWHRRHQYAMDSNRLLATSVPADPLGLPDHVAVPGYTSRYPHDAHGNITTMPHLAALGWDDRDRLRSADLGGGGQAYYAYDAAGERVRKVWEKAPGRTEERIQLGGFEIFRVRNGAGTVTLERETLHLTDGTQRVAMVETRTRLVGTDPAPRQVVRFQHGNHLGSVALELDADARLLTYEEFHPYGTTAYCAVRADGAAPKRYRYTGKERDEETGFSYHGARYYAPWLARWTACDPSGCAAGSNVYRYVSSNPVKFFDPDGTEQQVSAIETPKERTSAQDMRDAKIRQELQRRTGKRYDELVMSLGQGPRDMSPKDVRTALENNGTVIRSKADDRPGAALDEVPIQHPYQDRFISEGRIGPEDRVEAAKRAGESERNHAVLYGLAASGAGIAAGKATFRATVQSPENNRSAGVNQTTESPMLPRNPGAFSTLFQQSDGKLLNNLAVEVENVVRSVGVNNPRLTVAVSAGVLNGHVEYRVTVSDPKVYDLLTKNEGMLPGGLRMGSAPVIGPDGKLDPVRHVEVEGPMGLRAEGAAGIVVGTSRPACKWNCQPQWKGAGSPDDIWHTNVPYPKQKK